MSGIAGASVEVVEGTNAVLLFVEKVCSLVLHPEQRTNCGCQTVVDAVVEGGARFIPPEAPI